MGIGGWGIADKITPCSIVILEEGAADDDDDNHHRNNYLFRKFPTCMELENSLPCSEQSATGP